MAAVGATTVPPASVQTLVTAAPASSMPAPHVPVVQMHSSCTALPDVGAVQTGTLPVSLVVGNVRAVDFRMRTTSALVRAGLADSISATVPVTSGVAKLVPRLGLFRPSEYVAATGPVVPVLVVVRIGYRQAPDALTQLPPGAAIVTSGPMSEKPTLVPAWRRPATAITMGVWSLSVPYGLQLAGVPTGR